MNNNKDESNLPKLEKMFNSFKVAGDGIYFQRELLSNFTINPTLRFEEINTAIALNGGMMAFIKRSDVLVLRREAINNHILAFSQNGSNQHNIPIRSNEELKNIVFFDFDENEKLYVINNDGECQKIDIFNKHIHPISTGITFKGENLISAKLFGKGFFGLTNSGSFYYTSNFKLPVPELFFSSQQVAGFGEVVIEEITDYIIIPETRSASKKIELLFCSPQIPGIVRAVGWGRQANTVEGKDIVYILENTYIIYNTKSEPFYIYGHKKREKQQGDMGVIDALAIPVRANKVAFYKKGGVVIVFDSTLDEDIEINPRIIFKFEVSSKLSEQEREEQQSMLELENETKFMFCGDNAVCLIGRRLIMIRHIEGDNTIVYKMHRKYNPKTQSIYAKPEIDGLRVITPDACYFISQVDDDFTKICNPYSEEPGRMLLIAYEATLGKDPHPTMGKKILELKENLVQAIDQVLKAATLMFDSNLQLYFLKAAKHGKLFTDMDSYNHEKFAETCNTLRIVNSLRQDDKPRLLTFEQYRTIKGRIIKLLIRNHNFAMAEEIAKFLELSDSEIYYKFILNHVKQLDSLATETEEIDLFVEIDKIFEKANDIPFLKLAKKCFALGWNTLGNKILEKEKSALVKIPELLDQQLWKEALEIAINTLDSNVIFPVLDKIIRSEDVVSFIKITQKIDKLEPYIKDYLSKTDTNGLVLYEEHVNQYEDLYYSYVEEFFDTTSVEKKKALLSSMKKCLTELKRAKYDSKELDYLKSYTEELHNDFKLKEQNYNQGVIKDDDELSVNCSHYELLKKVAIPGRYGADKLTQSSLLHGRVYGLMTLDRDLDHGVGKAIEALKNEKKLKDRHLTMVNLMEILYEGNHPSRVLEAAKKIVEPGYCAYKVEILKALK